MKEFIQDAAESDMRDRDAEFVRKRERWQKAEHGGLPSLTYYLPTGMRTTD